MKRNVPVFLLAICGGCISFSQTPIDTCRIIHVKQDAFVTSLPVSVNNNYGYLQDMLATAWTYGGIPLVGRTLVLFDWGNTLPIGATITSAVVNLYSHVSPHGNGTHSSLSGSNIAYLRRITSPWTEYGVTWNTQPTVSTTNQVTLPQSISPTQNYINIDVLPLIEDIRATTNYGIMFELQDENYYRNMIFASKEEPDPDLHPTLEICYTYYIGIESEGDLPTLEVFPNPATNNITVKIPEAITGNNYEILVQNASGKIIDLRSCITYFPGKCEISVSELTAGLYFISITGNGILSNTKFVKQ